MLELLGAMETCLKYYLIIKENNFAYKYEMPLVFLFCFGFFWFNKREIQRNRENELRERIVLTSKIF